VLLDFRHDLVVRHFVGNGDTIDAPAKLIPFQTLFQLAFSFAGAEYPDGLRIADAGDDLVVVDAEVPHEDRLPHVIGWRLLRPIVSPATPTAIRAELFLDVGFDPYGHFPIVRDHHDHGLPMVDP